MYTEIQIRIKPEQAGVEETLRQIAARVAGVGTERICRVDIVRKSIDARQKEVMFNLVAGLHIDRIEEKEKVFVPAYRDVSDRETVVVVGAGPAGLFAALRLIERGFRPLVLERGKAVEDRKKDLNGLYKTGMVDEDSNFGFGEGGAGTFSDGKLYTRSKKRGDVRRAMEILVYHGANPAILVEAHPHVGTDKLPGVIVNIRKTIQKQGGEIRFGCRVTGLIIRENSIQGVIAGGQEIASRHVILATGHSARDVYNYLYERQIQIEAKGIAVGVRLEHPQELIDQIQYHRKEGRGKYLPAAEYSFVTQANNRGVYSFCMCPGGFVVPAASGPKQVVVNGMSPSNRGSCWSNSGMVVEIRPEDYSELVGQEELYLRNGEKVDADSPLALMAFQERLEEVCWLNGGMKQTAPAQRMDDFMRKKNSFDLPVSSYTPGLLASPLHFWMPEFVTSRLREGFRYFGKVSRGFLTNEATMIGVETRTSAPVRILRDRDTYQHVTVKGLFPCGEGAGYAGGIVSAAIDGERCAEGVVQVLNLIK